MSTESKKILVELNESAVAREFLGMGAHNSMYLFTWEEKPRNASGHWRVVKVHNNHDRSGLLFVLEDNGQEIERTEIPFSVIFAWLPRLMTAAEKGGLPAPMEFKESALWKFAQHVCAITSGRAHALGMEVCGGATWEAANRKCDDAGVYDSAFLGERTAP